jgi:hypothetical protein
MNARSPSASRAAAFGALLLLASCQSGTKETVETIRAQHVEIIDESGTTKMDVADRLRALEERVKQLEAENAKRDAERGTIAPAPPSASPDADARKPPAHPAPARSGSPFDLGLHQ